MMAWLYLLIAILFEASWVIGLRFTRDWTRLWPSFFVVLTYIVGLFPLSLAGRTIPSSTLYAIWVGGGIVTVALIDFCYFNESVSVSKIICIILILSGAIGLKLTTSGH